MALVGDLFRVLRPLHTDISWFKADNCEGDFTSSFGRRLTQMGRTNGRGLLSALGTKTAATGVVLMAVVFVEAN